MQGTLKESNHTNPLRTLLVDELRDLLHAEGQLVQAFPKMAEAAHHPKLKEAFQKHLKQTGGHVERLKQAFELLGSRGEHVDVPLVVRLDGNNADLGRQILTDAGLPGLEQVDTMDGAARRAAELAAG